MTSGTVVTLHCEEGYRLTGSDKVTCATDSMFTFSSEPTCTSESKFIDNNWVKERMQLSLNSHYYCLT